MTRTDQHERSQRPASRRAGPLFGALLVVVHGPTAVPAVALIPRPLLRPTRARTRPRRRPPNPRRTPPPEPTPEPTPEPDASPPAPTPTRPEPHRPAAPRAERRLRGRPPPVRGRPVGRAVRAPLRPSARLGGPRRSRSAAPTPERRATPALARPRRAGGPAASSTSVDRHGRRRPGRRPPRAALDDPRIDVTRFTVYRVRFQVLNDGEDRVTVEPALQVADGPGRRTGAPGVGPRAGALLRRVRHGRRVRGPHARRSPSPTLRLAPAATRSRPRPGMFSAGLNPAAARRSPPHTLHRDRVRRAGHGRRRLGRAYRLPPRGPSTSCSTASRRAGPGRQARPST